MKLRFWGTRGSIPTPGLKTVRYGGNTSCVEVRTGDNLIILDAGSGIRQLGLKLIATEKPPIVANILFSHTHWDHIQGFPFFSPAFVKGNRLTLYGAKTESNTLEEVLARQMKQPFFPVDLYDLQADLSFREVDAHEFLIPGARIKPHYMNHPSVCVGYRLEAEGRVLVYATDNEPYSEDSSISLEKDLSLVEFARDADLLIHDAQYSWEEYQTRRGWGHSFPDYAVAVALAAGVKRLALSHHDPEHDDDAIRSFEEYCHHLVKAQGIPLEVFAAAEGMELTL